MSDDTQTHYEQSPSLSKKATLRRGVLFIAIIAFAIFCAFIAARLLDLEQPALLLETKEVTPYHVEIATLDYIDDAHIKETYTAVIKAGRSSNLGFDRGGRIASLYVDLGDKVKKGQLLAKLDTRSLESQLNAAEAEARRAAAQLKLTELSIERQQDLFDKGHVSAARLDQVTAEADSAKAQIAAAEARADQIRVEIDLMSLRAPFAGQIETRLVDEGAIAAPGISIFSLNETAALEAEMGLPERIARELQTGKTYEFTHDGKSLKGLVKSQSGQIDLRTRTINTLFEFSNEGLLRPGSIVKLRIATPLGARGAWVALDSLVSAKRGLWALYVVETCENKTDPKMIIEGGAVPEQFDCVGMREVEVLHLTESLAFIRGSAETGDDYIVSGVHALVPGMAVQPKRARS